MNKRLEKIEHKLEDDSSKNNNNSAVEFDRIHNLLPVKDEERLQNLGHTLQDVSVFNNMISHVRMINVLVVS